VYCGSCCLTHGGCRRSHRLLIVSCGGCQSGGLIVPLLVYSFLSSSLSLLLLVCSGSVCMLLYYYLTHAKPVTSTVSVSKPLVVDLGLCVSLALLVTSVSLSHDVVVWMSEDRLALVSPPVSVSVCLSLSSLLLCFCSSCHLVCQSV